MCDGMKNLLSFALRQRSRSRPGASYRQHAAVAVSPQVPISQRINCGLCVDACDGVMSKLGRPRGLIDYESWSNIERGRRSQAPVSRLVRLKTIGLTAACLALAGTIGFAIATKTNATLSVEHDRDPLAVRLSDGSVRNAYTVELLNKSPPAVLTRFRSAAWMPK